VRAPGGDLRVLLLRNVVEERRASMDRYADGLERALASSPRVAVSSTSVRAVSGQGRLGGALARYLTNFARYPLHAARSRGRASIFHVLDHGNAHLAAVLPRDRTVVTCHDLMLLRAGEVVPGQRGRWSSRARFRWTVSYLRKVGHVVCDSTATRDDVQRICGVDPDRMSIVPPGVDEHFRRLPDDVVERARGSLPELGRYRVLHVCSEHGFFYKNVPMTLKVVARLRSEGVDAMLVRVGRRLAPDERLAAERLGIGDAIVDCGRVPEDRLVELYHAADALLYPSFYEGFAWPPLEAMACGTPVVASTAPALEEAIGDAGLLAAPDDEDSLVRNLRDALTDDSVAAELRRKGLERVTRYSWHRTAEELTRIYSAVARAAEA
jgi:glycosyltransferase involved in cell wall biosynthesis